MPNTFGGYPLVDPRFVRAHRERFRRDMLPLIERANSLYIPVGLFPVKGWILIERSVLNKLSKYLNTFELQLDSFVTPAMTFSGLSIVQSQCVTTGVSADPNAIYLVELTDNRGILCNKWFEYPTISYYNVLSPAYPDNYYDSSLNSGTAWTWDGMVSNLWAQINGFLGATYPGLPISPANQPINWIFPGTGCYRALCQVLEHIGCTVTCDLTSAKPYGIVQEGGSDTAFSSLTTLYDKYKEDDQEWIDEGSGRVPGWVKVCFHRVNQYYGTEEEIRRDSLQWETGSIYSVTVAAPVFFTGALGTAILWDDFAVRYDINGNPLAADVATAATIATNRVNQFYDRIYSGTQGYMRRVYSGVLPFKTGSQVDGVAYKQDFGGTGGAARGGWTTTIIQGPSPPFEEVAYG